MGGGQGGGRNGPVLVTGCSDGGIGAALAAAFAKAGYKVIATSRSVSTMKELGQIVGIEVKSLDVSDYESIKSTVESIEDEFGPIGVLINNAGMLCSSPVLETPLELMEKVFKTNVFGSIALAQAVAPRMVVNRKGLIVNVGSVSAYAPGPWTGSYVASKAAIHAFSDSMRVELEPFGVEVMLLVPGAIKSNIGKNATNTLDVSKPDTGFKIYKEFEQAVYSRASLSQTKKSTTGEEFAEKVVQVVSSKRSPPAHLSVGHLSTEFSLLYYFPLWVRDILYKRVFMFKKAVSN